MKSPIYQKLSQDYKLLQKQLDWLEISFNECKQIGIKDRYPVDEFGRFETLCSRYSRSNIIVHEYIEEVLEYSEKLIVIINNTLKYIKNIDN